MKLLLLLASSFILLNSCQAPETTTKSQQEESQANRWKVTNIDAGEAQTMMSKNPDVKVLDVRTPAEFAEGHIKGAINVDYKASDFEDQLAKINNQQSYILHCRSGARSSNALPVLKKNHFGMIYHLDKGFNAWQSAGLPVEK